MPSNPRFSRVLIITALAHLAAVAGVVTMSNLSAESASDADTGPLYIEFFTFSPPPEESKDDLKPHEDHGVEIPLPPTGDVALVQVGLAPVGSEQSGMGEPAPSQDTAAIPQEIEIRGSSNTTSYWDTVRQQIARHLRYPASMRRRHVEDRVVLRVAISASGELVSVESLPPQGDPALARAAMRAVRRAQPYPAPAGENDVAADLPIRFDIED